MTNTGLPNWYQTNWQIIQQEILRLRQLLETFIEGKPQDVIDNAIAPSCAIALLSSKFNLSAFARDILLLCVGMEIEPSFANLCAQANGNSDRNYPTLSLALSIFPGASLSVLSPQNPLQLWQMIEFAPGFSFTQTAMRIDKRILCYLLGEVAFDEQLLGIVTFPEAKPQTQPLPPTHERICDRIIATWSQTQRKLPLLQLCGYEASSKYQIVNHICDRLNFNLGIINAAVLPTAPHELHQLKQRWEREAILGNRVLLLDCDSISTADPLKTTAISLFIENLQTPAIISTLERLPSRQQTIVSFDVSSLGFHEQKTLWEIHLGTAANQLNGQLTKLVSQFNLSPATIKAACQQITTQYALSSENPESVIANQLWDFCRTQARPRLDDLAQRINATSTWEDLVLPDPQRQVLCDIFTHLQQRSKVYQDWGFASKSNRGFGITALFHGESGTGKTMAAEVLAKQYRLDLYRIDLSAVVSKYIGETEKNLARIFDAAEAGGVILLFDEADALFGKRSEVKDSRDRHANVEVSYLLQRMEAYGGLAILTTNLKNALDTAFLRRIRFMVDFPFPAAQYRAQIWQRIFPPQTPTKGLDYQKLGQLQVAGGNIRNIAMNAAFIAADANEPVMMKHILTATQRDYLKLQRLLTKEEVKGWV
ncbi:AAA ATPase central domain-containing protein [Nostoc commune NIES-4072]|uniref:AAA ATPase central domain-containing protein n=1 Tax=Nostoc commune NIES-4072 TaxID=2005467 RepID=A0A2R5G410_NOSCO|nr:ATP-binding protein [Nostoc commune]BBD70138.1 AAA ATPase central domain-containing protein [Nostoc commune HK-02]GBG22791.1 AAA ATPase central domain-containing protein [Nostoc commune NIES-4072]